MAQIIKKQLAEGVSTRRVGLISSGAPARQHSEILDADGKQVPGCSALHACPQACITYPGPAAPARPALLHVLAGIGCGRHASAPGRARLAWAMHEAC